MFSISTIDDILEVEKKPLSEYQLAPSTYAAIKESAEKHSDQIALRYIFQGTDYKNSRDYTFKDVLANIHRAANLFTELGVGEEDVVSFILPNLPQTIFTLFGAEAIGIVNPINPLLEPEVMADIMKAAGTKVLVTLGPFVKTDIWNKVASIVDQVPTLETVLTIKIGQYLDFPKSVLAPALAWKAGKGVAKPKVPVRDFDKLMALQPSGGLVSKRVAASSDIASFFHTGGTTGIPKLAQHTHGNEVYNAWATTQLAGLEGKTLFCGLPFFHVNAVILTGLTPFASGGTTILGSPAGYRGEGILDNFWKIVDRYKVNFFSGVPTVYANLLNKPLEESDVSSLEGCICGAAPMPVEVFNQFQKRTGLSIIEGYGLTEGTCVSSANPLHGERRIGSVGLRLPYQEMKTVILGEDGKFERDCKADEIGAVVVRGPNVFPGYKDQFHNKGLWVDDGDDKGAWLNTGDLGRMDAQQYLWLTGRKKEIIIRGGHNIDPKLIEDPLVEHPQVSMAAAVGRPDAHSGEVPVAYVQLEPGAEISEEELLEFAKDKIGERAAVPKKIYIINELPLTPVGKIFKPALARQQIEEVLTEATGKIDGLGEIRIKAEGHKQYGTLVDVQVENLEGHRKALEEAFGVFAVRVELREIGKVSGVS